MANNEVKELANWSNSDGYLQIIHDKRIGYFMASEQENVDEMILKIRSYYSLIRPFGKDYEIFKDDKALKQIQKAKQLYNTSQRRRAHGDPQIQAANNRVYNEALELLRETYDNILDVEMQETLIFREAEDPSLEFFGGRRG